MNAISASASRHVAVGKVTTPPITARRLANAIAPRNHAGKGAWDNNADIPPIAWLGAVVFAFVFLVVLPWLGRGAGF